MNILKRKHIWLLVIIILLLAALVSLVQAAPGDFVRTWGWGVATGANQFEICDTLPCQVGIRGCGEGQLDFPHGIDVDDADNIYAANTNCHRISQFDSNANFVRMYGSHNNPGNPHDLAVDSAGNIVVGDRNNKRVTVFEGEVTNQPPTADAGGPYSGDEGAAIALSGASASDPDGDPLTIGWSVDDPVTCSFDDAGVLNPNLTCNDDGTYQITLTVDDGVNDPVSDSATVTVNNVAPTIDSLTAPLDPVDINDQSSVVVEVTFSDPGPADTHDVTWDWGDSNSDTQYGAASPASQGHTYDTPGVYKVTVTVTDDDGGSASQPYEFIVIYDPTGGFVTGGGWIMSPEGAYAADPSLTGKANFGFVSKYKKGASTPTGETEFQFKAGDLNFHSDSYDWLVVAGHDKAKYKGVGTINGSGNYGFMLTAKDSSPDTFRIKIWDKDAGDGVVYDNKMGVGDDSYDGTELGGGNIKVHKAK